MTRPDAADFEAAADWVEEFETAPAGCDPARKSAFLDWLDGSPQRLAALQKILAVLADPALTAALEQITIAPSPAPIAPRPALAFGMALAASLAVMVGGSLWWRSTATQTPITARYAASDQMLTASLSDGSRIHLDPHSTLATRFLPRARQLDLVSGRGLFEVAHAADRPFTVQSGPLAVTAVGTVFSVDRQTGGVSVRVEQGRVRVAGIGTNGAIVLAAGQGLYRAANGRVVLQSFVPDARAASEDAWLTANEERLDVLLARLGRITGRSVTCDAALADRPVTGRFRRADVEGTLRLIALENGWRLDRNVAGWRLRPG